MKKKNTRRGQTPPPVPLNYTADSSYVAGPAGLPEFSSWPVVLGMHEEYPLSAGKPYLGPEYPIARKPEDGAEPDWRTKVALNYILRIIRADDQKAELAKVLSEEKNAYIREAVRFHCEPEVPFPGRTSLQRAIICHKENRTGRAIKAMVVNGRSPKEIAEWLVLRTETLEYFEKLFWDVRPFLDKKFWLLGHCKGDRWLEIALEGHWPILEKVMLQQWPQGADGPEAIRRFFWRRVQRYISSRDDNNVPPNEEDLDLFERFWELHKSGALSNLDEPPEEIKDPNLPQSYVDLTPAGRDRVSAFLHMILDGAATKSGAYNADKEKAEPAEHSENQGGQTGEGQASGAI